MCVCVCAAAGLLKRVAGSIQRRGFGEIDGPGDVGFVCFLKGLCAQCSGAPLES